MVVSGHEAHGPGAVVVGGELGVGVDLFAEEGFGEAAVGLVALHDEGAGGIGAVLEFDRGWWRGLLRCPACGGF